MKILLQLILGLGLIMGPAGANDNIHIYNETQIHSLFSDVADKITALVKRKPNAVILLPTGSTPERLYAELVKRFQQDTSIDFSKASFFNLDEYVGLEPNNPLSYSRYMQVHFYQPLKRIDASRAPSESNSHIPAMRAGETPKQAAARYGDALRNAGKIDLAILGIGGISPAKDAAGKRVYRGGHLGFNDHGTPPNQATHVVELTKKTQEDTYHRFRSLQAMVKSGELEPFKHDIPSQAITIGLQEILSASEVILMATGEGKQPVIEQVFKQANNPNIPASYLLTHHNTHWYFDENSGKSIRPKTLASVDSEALAAALNNYPEGKTILIISPHPDDDVISMGGTIQKLMNKGNHVHVVYAVTGANAVRQTSSAYKRHIKAVTGNTRPTEAQVEEAKARVREEEARVATVTLGVPSENLHFLRSEFYHRRGIPGIDPITPGDQQRMHSLLQKVSPDYIYFAAEDDPNGTHGLASNLLARTIAGDHHFDDIVILGYRGAWEEWSLAYGANLEITTFTKPEMDAKVAAVKAHVSQLKPMFPGNDSKRFYVRMRERNASSKKQLDQVLGDALPWAEYAEVFYRFSP
ncbi:MAG: 6-phosphogluconolactonase, partial [Alphaproteobacteria bacterium]